MLRISRRQLMAMSPPAEEEGGVGVGEGGGGSLLTRRVRGIGSHIGLRQSQDLRNDELTPLTR